MGDNAIKGSIEALDYLKQNGKKLYYITNNSTRNPLEVQKKFASFGFEAELKDVPLCSI